MPPFSIVAIHQHTHFPRHHIHFHTYVLPEPTESMEAENGLGAEILSRCGVVSAWNEDRHPCFVWVLNMLDFIILGFMDISMLGDPLAFQLDMLEKLMICEVPEPRGVVCAQVYPFCQFRLLPFTQTPSSQGITYTFRHMCCQSQQNPW